MPYGFGVEERAQADAMNRLCEKRLELGLPAHQNRVGGTVEKSLT